MRRRSDCDRSVSSCKNFFESEKIGIALDASLGVEDERVAGLARVETFYHLSDHAVQPANAVFARGTQNGSEAEVVDPCRVKQGIDFAGSGA